MSHLTRLPTRLKKNLGILSLIGASLVVSVATPGCKRGATSAQSSFDELRKNAVESRKHDEVADWFLAEMLRPGGKTKQARRARKHLDSLDAQGVLAQIARGLDDSEHGKNEAATESYFQALLAAKNWPDERAPLYAWYSAVRVQESVNLVQDFGRKHKTKISELIENPGGIGFRAYAVVVEMWGRMAFAEAIEDVDSKLAERLGCVDEIGLAGPFGSHGTTDVLRSFDAENPGPWLAQFKREVGQTQDPRRLKTDRGGCDIFADEPTTGGVFYAQTFITIDEPKDLILSASGSTQMWVNDSLVLDRDVRTWGVWPKFGVKIRINKGRHRISWKVGDPSTALRIVHPNGTPANLNTSSEDSLAYSLVPPQILDDPNELIRFIEPSGVKDPGDDLTRYIAAYMANKERQADVAAVLFEPFIEKPEKATGISLGQAAVFVQGDPIYDESQTRDLRRELELRAAKKDPGLWYPRFRNVIWEARQKGPSAAVSDLENLTKEFPEVSSIHFALAEIYEKLNWGPEHEGQVLELLERFGSNEHALRLAVDHFDVEGNHKKVEELLKRILSLDPDSEILVVRALKKKRYEDALKELRRLKTRRPSRKDIDARIERILVRSGNKQRTFEQLKAAVEREPRDVHARLALADAKLALGKGDNPLTEALVETVQSEADPSPIAGAIDLLEGITALEPYRLDGIKVIDEYEQKAKHLDGTAARVLDYGALWVRGDGSSRFLEHEIVRIQSEEAIKRFAETRAGGLVLHLRVIKKDGTILEPEEVAGKPTVTMPHLEVGDYIETERIVSQWGDGQGNKYLGPGWYFREKDVAYARSEFVVIAPADKKLILETHNGVPTPEVEKTGSLVIHRYRVDESPAAPVEPMSPPAQEFLPRVSVGWGLSFENRIRALSRSMISLVPNDPRVIRIAKTITKDEESEGGRVRALYRWVLDNVQDGKETDGRRVVVSRNGNRWRGFQTLCRALDIPVRWALAESRLSPEFKGPIEIAERPLSPLLVVGDHASQTWLSIENKFSPFGTVPSHLRGERAYLLGDLEPVEAQVPSEGAADGIRYQGEGALSKNGTAELELELIFLGAYATSLRNGLAQVPENQLGNIIESKLLGQQLQGAQLKNFQVMNQKDLDLPLIIRVKTVVPQFATPSGAGLLVSPPFMPRMTQLTTLATRATPLMISQQSMTGLDLTLKLPSDLKALVRPTRGSTKTSSFSIEDTAHQGSLRLVRDIETKSGRIAPADYPRFQRFTTDADAALSSSIRLE